MNNIDSIYSAHILELANDLANYTNLKDLGPEYHIISYNNPSCGDKIELGVRMDDNIISDIKVNIDGCVISKASTNLLVTKLKGKSLEDVSRIMPYDMHNMLGVNVGEMRAPCVLTSLNALNKYLDKVYVRN